MLEILKTLKDTPLPIVLVIGGLIFLLIPFIQKISTKEVGVETSNQSFAGLIGFILLVTGIGLYIVPSGIVASTLPTVSPPTFIVPPTNPVVSPPTISISQPTSVPANPAPPQQFFPTATPSLEFVYREATGGWITKTYDVTLGDGEVISGQGVGFQQQRGCVAYIIKGPGHFVFSVTDGAWIYYKNVTTTDQIELLLQNQVDSLRQNNCAPTSIIRLP